MGQVHNELRRGPFSAALKAAVGDSRGGSGIERYGETLTPIIDLWRDPQHRFLRQEVEAFVAQDIPAGGAGTFATIALVNPAGSSSLISPLHLQGGVAAVAPVKLQISTQAAIEAALGVLVVGSALDTRWRDRAAVFAPIGQVRTGNPAAIAGSIISQPDIAPNVFRDFVEAEDVVLSPGWGLVLMNLDDAALLHSSLTWRERKALPGEL